uniref:ISXO2-like transposase domain-containing protein n=1 Tax=Cuerna arida TaxID=1464854 RepID=A0A1B6EZZ5_9HEMI
MAMNMRFLCHNVFLNTDQCFKWLQDNDLAPLNPKCSVCGDEMKTDVKGGNQIRFRCKKAKNAHDVVQNALLNTFFEDSKFGLMNIVTVMYYFSWNLTNYDFLINECSFDGITTCRNTIADWLSFCREVCFLWLGDKFENEELLGGEGVVVEVDGAEIKKRKFKSGRLVQGTWVIGIMELNTNIVISKRERRDGRFRLEVCPENSRSAEFLVPLIVKHVKPRTTIVTNLWKTYFGLNTKGYDHFIVNHNKFVDLLPSASTKTLKSNWRPALKTGLRGDCNADRLAEYMYRREVMINGDDPFEHFLKAVKHVYPTK